MQLVVFAIGIGLAVCGCLDGVRIIRKRRRMIEVVAHKVAVKLLLGFTSFFYFFYLEIADDGRSICVWRMVNGHENSDWKKERL